MNNQEAFNKVCAHLKQQNARSVMPFHGLKTPRCSYAGENGLACAVGCFFPRELAEKLDALGDSSWESIASLPRQSEDEDCYVAADELHVAKEAIAVLAGVNAELLGALQRAHDDSDDSKTPFWEQVYPRLMTIARRYGLEIPPELQP